MPFNRESVNDAIAAQHLAAHDESDQVRTIAGPGTGKSFTIEERVCWLLDNGTDRRSIAAMSFTRAAAEDLQRRVHAACMKRGHPQDGLAISTIHSLALRALRAHGALATYPVDPMVLDRWELEHLFDAEFGTVASIGSKVRRREIREDHEAFWSTGSHDPRSSQKPPDPAISESERDRFRQFHGPRTQLYACVLPGEIVQRCVQLIDTGHLDPVALLGIEHLIVDEFQDLNPMDLRFVYGLVNLGATLFVTGDDDQSLYAFRYAFPEGIQKFTEQFPDAGDHTLERCFRCSSSVLATAETLIREFSAPGRIAKHYISLYEDADPRVEGGVGCWRFADGREEAHAIAQSCARLITAGMAPREIMVLLSNVRALGPELATAFEEAGIPFDPPRDKRFKDTADGRALLTALRIVERPDDYVALRTLLELRRGVGIKTAAQIGSGAIAGHLNFRDLFYEELPKDVFAARQLTALELARSVVADLQEWSAEETVENRRNDLHQVVAAILGGDPDENWEDEAQLLPSGAFLSELSQYLSADKDDRAAEILSAINQRLDIETDQDDVLPQRVRVMTMHGAKGLSGQMVFIPGLEEELLPGPARRPYPGQILEGARMLYVSITRARLGCVLSHSTSRFMNGQVNTHVASRYASHLGRPFEDRTGGMPVDTAKQAVEATQHL